jgi:hypothetical protein
MNTTNAIPDITVVIASLNGLPYPLACLQALDEQEFDGACEVVVADCSGPATVAAIRERHPAVRVLAFDGPRSVPFLRSRGAEAARAPLVAITEDHCVPSPNWLHELRATLRRTGWAAAGGGVENGSRRRLIDWTVYFCEYSNLMAPVTTGPADGIPGMNVVYDRVKLGDRADLLTQDLWENEIHDRIRGAGFEIGLDSGIVVHHCKRFTFSMFNSERFHYSRAYAGTRVRNRAWPVRLGYTAATSVLPALLCYRIGRTVFARRRHRLWFVACLPLVAYFSVVWAVGEAVGYLRGPGSSILKIR